MKILAFFGSDLKYEKNTLLQEYYANSWTILALDVDAIIKCKKSCVPYILVDDLLENSQRVDAKSASSQWEKEWFLPEKELFTINGVCWPELDLWAMYAFWFEVAMAEQLAKSFAQHKVDSVTFFEKRPRRPGFNFYPADIFSAYWQYILPKYGIHPMSILLNRDNEGKIRKYPKIFQITKKSFLNDIYSMIIYIRFNVLKNKQTKIQRNNLVKNGLIKGKIILACHSEEIIRFEHIIRYIVDRYPDQLIIATTQTQISPSIKKNIDQIVSECNVPVLLRPLCNTHDKSLSKRYHLAYRKLCANTFDERIQFALKNLEFHFKYFFDERWPKLMTIYEYWDSFLKNDKAKAVYVSSVFNSENQIPALVANKYKIPTYSLPHAILPPPFDINNSKYLLCNNLLQKEIYIKSGFNEKRIINYSGLIMPNQYVTVGRGINSSSDMTRVLVLLDPAHESDRRLIYKTSLSSKIKGLYDIFWISDKLKQKIHFYFKTHPLITERNIFKISDKFASLDVLPKDSDLNHILKEIDLVLSLNYLGSALVHAIQIGKPIIYYWTDPLVGLLGSFITSEIMLKAGLLINKRDLLFNKINQFICDSKYSNDLSQMSEKFANKYL